MEPPRTRRAYGRKAGGLRRLGPVAVALCCVTSIFCAAACGSRSELFDWPEESAGDAGTGASQDGSVHPEDATLEAPGDDAEAPDATDAPIDATPPPDDAGISCGDSSTASVAYLIDQTANFYSFDPPTLTARKLTTLACPTASGAGPFTMTVTEGTAYVMFNDNSLYAVDLSTLACTATPFDPSQAGLEGPLGLASAYEGGSEWLYVYGCLPTPGSCAPALARADLQSFDISLIGEVSPLPSDSMNDFPMDMKADGFGRLFAIDFDGTLLQIDPTNADVLGVDETGFAVSTAEALLTWNGTIYIIGGAAGWVDEYDLTTQTLSTLAEIDEPIVGAGSAPCVH